MSDMYINKGKISSLVGDTHATVVPSFSDSPVTTELVVPFFLRDCLSIGLDVVYVQYPDNTGVILSRMDGEWNHKLWDGLEVVSGSVKVLAGDISTGAVPSYNRHTHSSPSGETSEPR